MVKNQVTYAKSCLFTCILYSYTSKATLCLSKFGDFVSPQYAGRIKRKKIIMFMALILSVCNFYSERLSCSHGDTVSYLDKEVNSL